MLRHRQNIPLDYSLCADTVTVYHREGLTRQVLDGVHFEWTGERSVSGGIHADTNNFLLVVPYDCELAPGDRICLGEGPVEFSWEDLARMCVVKSLKRRYFLGMFSHLEARA